MIKNNIEKIKDSYKFWHVGLSEWRRVIYALIYRETKTSWGERALGILWALIEPITHILVLVTLRSILKGGMADKGEMSNFLFIATGIFSFFIFRNTFKKVKACVEANRALLVFPQIHILDFVFARSLLELMTGSSSFFFFIIGLHWLEGTISLVSIPNIIIGFLLMWVLGTGCGLLCIPLHNRFKIIDEIINVTLRIGYFVSGVMFSFSDIPADYRIYLEWIPTFHGIEYVRSGFSYMYGEYVHISYLFFTAFLSLLSGILIIRHKQHYILNK